MHGHGLINWWGFSPAFDLVEYIDLKDTRTFSSPDECKTMKPTVTNCHVTEQTDALASKGMGEPSVQANLSDNQNKKAFFAANDFEGPILRSNSSERTQVNVVRILLIGAGDPRLVLATLANRARYKNCQIDIYVLESRVELYGRLLLFLHLALDRTADNNTMQGQGTQHADVLLDVWANLRMMPESKLLMDNATRYLARLVTERAHYHSLLGCVSACHLLHRERDCMDSYLSLCRTLQCDAAFSWRQRLQLLHGVHLDRRRAEAELCWHLRLLPRLQGGLQVGDKQGAGKLNEDKTDAINKSLINIKTSRRDSFENRDGNIQKNTENVQATEMVNAQQLPSLPRFDCSGWGEEFLRWRESGIAFDFCSSEQDDAALVSNTTLMTEESTGFSGRRNPQRGYWGSIVCSPHPSLACPLAGLSDSVPVYGRRGKTGTETARENIKKLLAEIGQSESDVIEDLNDAAATRTSEQGVPDSKDYASCTSDSGAGARHFVLVSNVRIVLLSPSRLKKLNKLSEVPSPLHAVYLSTACAHLLTPILLKEHTTENTTLFVEDAAMLPDLTDGQVVQYRQRVHAAAREAGWRTVSSEDQSPLLHHVFRRCLP